MEPSAVSDIDALRDLVLAQQDSIDKPIGQNMALRTALLALFATYPDKPRLKTVFDRMQETATAKSLYVAAQDASLVEAERWLDELARPWREEQ